MALNKIVSRGKRCAFVLPRIIDSVATDEPNRTWITVPRSQDLKDGFRDITFADLQHAVNGFARWVEHKIGLGNSDSVMAYMG
jgi:acyl-coenzyme A synthetase/AMP-(fatty) acid ligase